MSRLAFSLRYAVPCAVGMFATFISFPLAAQGRSPLDPKAAVDATRYQSPLADFRAFDPDEAMQSWVDANRRVDEIGGWRTYLRQANPSRSSVRSTANSAATATSTSPVKKSDPVRRISASNLLARKAPMTASTGLALMAEGGSQAVVEGPGAMPVIPARIVRGECPRILTGLRIPSQSRSDVLSEDAKQLLRRLAQCFSTRQYIIGGHTDGRGPGADNLALSRRRAQAVLDFLQTEGVNTARLTVKGYGETRPIATNTSKRGRAKNRRIDFQIDRSARTGVVQ